MRNSCVQVVHSVCTTLYNFWGYAQQKIGLVFSTSLYTFCTRFVRCLCTQIFEVLNRHFYLLITALYPQYTGLTKTTTTY
jgi:hypothetical protein